MRATCLRQHNTAHPDPRDFSCLNAVFNDFLAYRKLFVVIFSVMSETEAAKLCPRSLVVSVIGQTSCSNILTMTLCLLRKIAKRFPSPKNEKQTIDAHMGRCAKILTKKHEHAVFNVHLFHLPTITLHR